MSRLLRGTVYLFMLLSSAAVGGLTNSSALTADVGDGVVVEWRNAAALAEGMRRDGLVVAEGGRS